MKANKGIRIKISDETGSGGKKGRFERSQGSGQGNARGGVGKRNPEKAKGDAEGQSTTDSRRDQLGEIESRGSEEDRQDEFTVLSRQRPAVRKTVRDELAFLVAWRSFAQNTRQR